MHRSQADVKLKRRSRVITGVETMKNTQFAVYAQNKYHVGEHWQNGLI